MRLATFRFDGGLRLGVVSRDLVLDVSEAKSRLGRRELPDDMISLMEGGEEALSSLKETLAELSKADMSEPVWHRIADLSFGPPVPNPKKVLALAGNYMEHIKESKGKLPMEEEKITPYVFMKPPSTTVSGDGDPIVIPKIGVAIDWEVELALVIGRKGKYIPASETERYIFGYTIMNDVSERKFYAGQRSSKREMDKFFDWLNGKWFDGFAPSGPVIVTRDEIPDPHDLDIRLRVNGEVMQDSNTKDMIFSCNEIVEFISRIVTLEPGDIISTGTPSGVGLGRNVFLKEGDMVECDIERIGLLRNPVVKER